MILVFDNTRISILLL